MKTLAAVLLVIGLIPSTVTAGSGDRILDREYCFTLDAPDADWTLLSEGAARKLSPDALAGTVSVDGLYCVVIAEHAPDANVPAYAEVLLDGMALENRRVASFEELEFKGCPAARFAVRGTVSDVPLEFVNTVFSNDDYLFQLVCWGTEGVVSDSAFAPVWDAFSILEGKVVGRAATVSVTDAYGVGWRFVDGVFESAAVGLRARPRRGWRVAVGSELDMMNPDAEVGLVHTNPDIYVTVVSERAVGVDQTFFRASIIDSDIESFSSAGRPLITELFGRETEFTRYQTRGEPRMELLKAVLFEGEACLQVSVVYGATLGAEVEEPLRSGLLGLDLLDESAIGDLARSLDDVPDQQNVVGPTFALRRGTYRDFEHEFSWSRPGGFWRVLAGQQARGENADATLFLEEPSLGVYGLVIVEPDGGLDAEVYHERIVTNIDPAGTASPTNIQLGRHEALSSFVPLDSPTVDLAFRVTTLLHSGRAFQIVIYGTSGNVIASGTQLDAVLAGFDFETPVPAETHDAMFIDRRMGYSLEFPNGTWPSLDVTPPQLQPVGSIRQWSAGTQSVVVLSICAMSEGQDSDYFRALFRRLLSGGDGLLAGDPDSTTRGLFCGQPCDHLVWGVDRSAAHAFLLVRDRTFYAVLITGTDPDSITQYASGFDLID